MKLKKTSLDGKNHFEYLGHFSKKKYLERGHNDSGQGMDLSDVKAYENHVLGNDAKSGKAEDGAMIFAKNNKALKAELKKHEKKESASDPIGTSYPATEEE